MFSTDHVNGLIVIDFRVQCFYINIFLEITISSIMSVEVLRNISSLDESLQLQL